MKLDEFTNHRLRIWHLCQRTAWRLYGIRVPTVEYADRVARLLFGTCAQESNFLWERQHGLKFFGRVGAFGKWQVEAGSIEASIFLLRTNSSLAARATSFLFADNEATTEWLDAPIDEWLWTLRFDDNDVPACMFARLHYIRIPSLVPESALGQAKYYKEHYNTPAGAARVEDYMLNWQNLCLPIIELDKTE